MKRWSTDGRIGADSRYFPITRVLAERGWFRLARWAGWFGL